MWARNKQAGFTIVELLIVIVVIGILAAITIVAYNGIQDRGRDARRASDIITISKAIQRWSIESGQDFSAMPVGNATVRAQGWYNTNYSTSSFKTYLVNAGYLVNSIDDPVDTKGAPAKAYMIVECTSGDDKTRILLANMDMTQSQTVAQQIGGTACSSSTYSSYLATYGMDYAKKVTLE